jgi:heme/copper-type cytochrome/quinol oxidase subunit 4
MKRRKIYFYSALILTISIIVLLVTGSTLLTMALYNDKSIPLGTFITWTGMISLPLTIYWGLKELRKPSNKLNRILSGFIKTIIIFGILWVPISYLLAGNFSFTFSEKETFQGGQAAMRWFWRLSYGIGIGALLTLIVFWISLLFKKKKTVANNE